MDNRVGILGAGQLAMMLTEAGKKIEIQPLCFAPTISPQMKRRLPYIEASFDDLIALQKFSEQVSIVTIETENIPTKVLEFFAKQKKLAPNLEAILVSKDRLKEKSLFKELNIPTNDFYQVDTIADLDFASEKLKFPFIIKTRTDGYDGKGQYRITSLNELDNFKKNIFKEKTEHDQGVFLAEKFVVFDKEVSMIAVRDNQQTKFYDLSQNRHQQGILIETKNLYQSPYVSQAQQYVQAILEKFNYIGVLTVEFFVTQQGLVANEMAPRVHNSGHWTIEGTGCSQFENHLRAITASGLGDSNSKNYCLMKNIIGNVQEFHQFTDPNWHVHDYQKTSQPGRKLGHVTAVFDTETQREQFA